MKRVSRACQQCRSKHIKCNGRSPCSRCIAHAELHNITPSEICLYPEPKKRGRPSASTSTHHAHDHHSSHNSSSVVKKKLISTNKGKVIPPSSSSAPTITRSTASSTSPTNNVLNLQNSRWQKPPIATQPEPIVYWNENVQPYFVRQQLPITHAPQISATRTDPLTRQINLNPGSCDFGYFNQSRTFSLNPASSPNLMISNVNSSSVQNNTSTTTRNGNSNSCYRYSYNNSSNDTRSYSNNNNYNCTTAPHSSTLSLSSTNYSNPMNNNNSTRNNSSSPIVSRNLLLNGQYHGHHNLDYAPQLNLNSSFENFYYSNSNFNSEGSVSDSSSDSPYSSLTSTPEILPIPNTNNPSVTNSPLMMVSDYSYGASSNGLGQDSLSEDLTLEESSLLSAAKSEIAYVSSLGSYNISNCIYPSLLDRSNTTPYVKSGDNRISYDSIPVNASGWIY